MPHKRNPVTCEQICGLARVVRANAQAAFENVALWHERDISHSSVERVILPDSTILADYLLEKTTKSWRPASVYPERMMTNLEATRGLIFSGQLLLDLVEHGLAREDAYRLVQAHAMRAWQEGLDFKQLIFADKEIAGRVPRKQLEHAFDLPRQLKTWTKSSPAFFPRESQDRAPPRKRHLSKASASSIPASGVRNNKTLSIPTGAQRSERSGGTCFVQQATCAHPTNAINL